MGCETTLADRTRKVRTETPPLVIDRGWEMSQNTPVLSDDCEILC